MGGEEKKKLRKRLKKRDASDDEGNGGNDKLKNAASPGSGERDFSGNRNGGEEESEDAARERRREEKRLRKEENEARARQDALNHCLDVSLFALNSLRDAFGAAVDEAGGSEVQLPAEERDKRMLCSDGRCRVTSSPLIPPELVSSGASFGRLKTYQQVGVQWLWELHRIGKQGILADEMGLGKTAQTLCFLQWLYSSQQQTETEAEENLPSIVIAPAGLLDGWCAEAERWAPGLKVLKYHGSQKERAFLRYDWEDAEAAGNGYTLMVTTPAMLGGAGGSSGGGGDHKWLRGQSFAYAVVDEAHTLKNAGSLKTRAFTQKLLAKRRLLLTGTPVQNDLTELTTLLSIAMPTDYSPERIELALEAFHEVRAREHAEGRRSDPPAQEAVSSHFRDGGEASAKREGDRENSHEAESAGNAQQRQRASIAKMKSLADLVGSPGAKQRHHHHPKRVSDAHLAGGRISAAVHRRRALGGKGGGASFPPEVRFLQTLLAPFLLRRLKDEVMDDLPAKHEIVERCVLKGHQLRLYNDELRRAKRDLEQTAHGNDHDTIPTTGGDGENDGGEMKSDANQPEDGAGLVGNFDSIERSTGESDAAETTDTCGGGVQEEETEAIDLIFQRMAKSTGKDQADINARSGHKFVSSLLHRLRRCCNHPLLLQARYADKDYRSIAQYLKLHDTEMGKQRIERIEQFLKGLSDYELHQLVRDYSPGLDDYRLPSSAFRQSAKIRRLLRVLSACREKNEKVLIFSQFTTFLDVVEETLTRCPLPPIASSDEATGSVSSCAPSFEWRRIDGSVAVSERTKIMKAFHEDPNIHGILLSTRAGGHGLNLTAANHVVLMDQDWNPFNDRQAEDRAHRLGQTKEVTVHRLLCKGSIEERILSCCHKKLDLDKAFGGHAEVLQAAILKDCLELGHDSSNPLMSHAKEIVASAQCDTERSDEEDEGDVVQLKDV